MLFPLTRLRFTFQALWEGLIFVWTCLGMRAFFQLKIHFRTITISQPSLALFRLPPTRTERTAKRATFFLICIARWVLERRVLSFSMMSITQMIMATIRALFRSPQKNSARKVLLSLRFAALLRVRRNGSATLTLQTAFLTRRAIRLSLFLRSMRAF